MGYQAERIEFDYYVAPDGEVYPFDDAELRYLESFSGEGMPTVEYRTERGPFQDGETLIDWVLRPRVIQYVHRRGGHSRAEYWDSRADLLNLLRPNRQATAGARDPGQLRKILPSGEIRDIDVLIESGPRFEPRDPTVMDEWGFTEVLRFVAYDPTFYDPAERTQVFQLAAFPHLVFPVTLIPAPGEDMVFVSSFIDQTANILYEGTWKSLPVIEITGPAENPIITNLTTGEHIELTYNVPAGRVVTIDLAYGTKSVEDDLGTNLIGTVTADSDLATFHLAPDPEAPGGVNQVNIYFGGALLPSMAVMRWFTRYIGL